MHIMCGSNFNNDKYEIHIEFESKIRISNIIHVHGNLISTQYNTT